METIKTVNDKLTAPNYPYGSLKTTATFQLEFNPKKGSRLIFQTINPKTGRLNAPKKSTYDLNFNFLESVDGFISHKVIALRDPESVMNFVSYLTENKDLIKELTPEQIEFYTIQCHSNIKISIAFNNGSAELKNDLSEHIKALNESFKNKDLAWIEFFKANPYNWKELKAKYQDSEPALKFTCKVQEYSEITH